MTTPTFPRLLRTGSLLACCVCLASLSGCTAVSQHLAGIYNAALIHAQEKQDLASIRRDTREALAEEREKARRVAAEREVEEARIAAERQRLEMQFCQANQEAAQRKVKSNIREVLESKVAFNVEQGLELGELEVDVEQLQALMKEREEAAKKPQAPAEAGKKPCACCDRPCGCEPGLLRRFCPRCRHKPCEAEKKCGGPEEYARLEQEAAKKPLRPAEIPLKLPVRLTFGLQGPEMEEARIRRESKLPPEEGRRPCDYCRQPCTDPNGCPHCTQPVPGGTAANRLPPPPVPVVEANDPPKPTIDEEARRLRAVPLKSNRVSAVPTSFHRQVWQEIISAPPRPTTARTESPQQPTR